MNYEKNKWWGYLHVSGTIHIKRYFDYEDFVEADESPFVERRTGIVEAETREEAELIINEKLK
jgi:hypothetical protein